MEICKLHLLASFIQTGGGGLMDSIHLSVLQIVFDALLLYNHLLKHFWQLFSDYLFYFMPFYLQHYSNTIFPFSVKLEQGTVTALLEENGTVEGVLYKNKAGEELKAYAPLTIVCDGCFSNLRRTLCSSNVRPMHYSLFVNYMFPLPNLWIFLLFFPFFVQSIW